MALHLNISAAHVEFLAEDEKVTIIPNFRMDSLQFVCGVYGPFIPAIPTEVPLWLAVTLKKLQKCKINPPEWLSIDYLKRVLEGEKQKSQQFETLPFHYIEIASVLLDVASDDMKREDVNVIRALVEDIWTTRATKIRNGLLEVIHAESTKAILLNDIAAMEFQVLRPLLCEPLNKLYEMQNEAKIIQNNSTSQRQSSTSLGPKTGTFRTVRKRNIS
jgi:GINS complex subunit 2